MRLVAGDQREVGIVEDNHLASVVVVLTPAIANQAIKNTQVDAALANAHGCMCREERRHGARLQGSRKGNLVRVHREPSAFEETGATIGG